MITFATRDANVCDGGCKRLREKMQCTAMADAVHCKDGCSALRLRWAKLALKPSVLFLDKRKGRRGTPHTGHCVPSGLSSEPERPHSSVGFALAHCDLGCLHVIHQ